MARHRTQKYDEQRSAILASAAELFAGRGYHGTSMNDVADSCGLSKPALYHYYRDKDELLTCIAEEHVARLAELVRSVEGDAALLPHERLNILITRFLTEYSDARHSHRVLTEDVKFLPPGARERILQLERFVVNGFADAISAHRPDLQAADLHKTVAMLLFGMLNWMFTWVRADGKLTHAGLAPLVCDLFFHGLPGLQVPAAMNLRPAIQHD